VNGYQNSTVARLEHPQHVKQDSNVSADALQMALQILADPGRLGEAVGRLTPEQRAALGAALGDYTSHSRVP
jgi:hypothetical protein